MSILISVLIEIHTVLERGLALFRGRIIRLAPDFVCRCERPECPNLTAYTHGEKEQICFIHREK